MKIPTDKMMRFGFYKDVADSCCVSMEDRRDRYSESRYYWLHGSAPGEEPSAWNRIYPHIELVSSFLYAAESTRFSVEFGDSVSDVNHSFVEPFQRRLNNKWKDCGARHALDATAPPTRRRSTTCSSAYAISHWTPRPSRRVRSRSSSC